MNAICQYFFFSLPLLQIMDFSSNRVETITQNCFFLLPKLKLLILRNNTLLFFDQGSFGNVPHLVNLDISGNSLLKFSPDTLLGVSIYILNITFVDLTTIHKDVHGYSQIEVNMISTNDYRLCCLMNSGHTVCTRKPVWPQHCRAMFEVQAARIVLISQCVLILTLNVIAVVSGIRQYLKGRKPQIVFIEGVKIAKKSTVSSSFDMNVVLVHANDLIFDAYLWALFGLDKYFGDMYVLQAHQFLSGYLCKTLGFVSTFVVLNSKFLLVFLSVSRLVVVKYPFNTFCKQLKNVFKCLAAAMVCEFTICLLVLLMHTVVEQRQELSSPTCLFAGITLRSVSVFVTTILVPVLQFLSFCVVVTSYGLVITNMTKSTLHQPEAQQKSVPKGQIFLIMPSVG